ncbi:ATPase [Halolactibacillus miurensis]|uniref:ATPase n=2 Tax=Halolactibacillus TaxID=306539 RepID=A0A1I6UUP8_9BACI|nr:ATP-binding protein [Halolactibacillus miurensis]GEM05587.1 ATPase [Halolactibacillus miurensis]SFT05087.1 ATPase family associated with various cellular activities (AAA) [Halolactibacillus miurensis]
MKIEDVIILAENHFQEKENQFRKTLLKIAESEKKAGKKNNHLMLLNILNKYPEEKRYQASTGLKMFDNNKKKNESSIIKSKLYDVIYPSGIDTDKLVLSSEVQKKVDSLINEYSNKEKFEKRGIIIENRLLLCGPPGCGKTTIAYHIAKKMNLPIVYVRLDSLISSMLGQTSSNLRAIFEELNDKNVIIFLDEFDSIAKKRDDSNELGELKRVVNSLLQNIDKMPTNNFLISASNHEKLLDSAIWRRFNSVLYLDKPDSNLREVYIRNLLFEHKFHMDKISVEKASRYCSNFSFSEIQEVCMKTMKKSILNNSSDILLEDFSQSIIEVVLMYNFSKEKINYEKIIRLRENGLTLTNISELLGIPRSTLADKLKGGR